MQKMTSVRLITAQLSNAKQAVVIECLRYQHASREKESSTDTTLNKKETKKEIRQNIRNPRTGKACLEKSKTFTCLYRACGN